MSGGWQKSVDDRVSEWSRRATLLPKSRSTGLSDMVPNPCSKARKSPGMPVYDYQPTHNVFALCLRSLISRACAGVSNHRTNKTIRRIGLIYASLILCFLFIGYGRNRLGFMPGDICWFIVKELAHSDKSANCVANLAQGVP